MFSILFLNFWTGYHKPWKQPRTSSRLRERTCSDEQGKSCTNVDRAAHACVQRCNPLLSPRTTASRTPGRFDTVKSSPRSYSLCSTASPCSTSRISVHPNIHTSTWPYLQPTILIRSHAHMTHAWNPPILRYYLYPSLWSTLCYTQLMILFKSFWGPYRAGTRVSQRITLKLCITLLDVQGNGLGIWKRALSCLISTLTTAHLPFAMPSQPPYCVHYISAPFQHPNNVKTDLESSIKARSDHVFRYPVTQLLTEISTLKPHTEKHEIFKISTHFPISCNNHIT